MHNIRSAMCDYNRGAHVDARLRTRRLDRGNRPSAARIKRLGSRGLIELPVIY